MVKHFKGALCDIGHLEIYVRFKAAKIFSNLLKLNEFESTHHYKQDTQNSIFHEYVSRIQATQENTLLTRVRVLILSTASVPMTSFESVDRAIKRARSQNDIRSLTEEPLKAEALSLASPESFCRRR